jgi:hypothetical protein
MIGSRRKITSAAPLARALCACLAVLLAATFAAPTHARANGVRHEKISVRAPFRMPPINVPVFPRRDFVITDFGAKPGGEFKNNEAIRKAVEACNKAGGGRVVVTAGVWLTGAIHLKSNVNLHLAKDAVLSFSDDPADYLPAVRTSSSPSGASCRAGSGTSTCTTAAWRG